MEKEKINIAQLLYSAYPHADLLPLDPDQDCRDLQALLAAVNERDIGDSLFRFMVFEIVEGGESTLDGAVRVIEQADQDVQAVLTALQAACGCPTQVDEQQAACSETDLLDACKTLVSYISELLYGLDDQVDLSEIDQIRQAKEAIANYRPAQTLSQNRFEMNLQEQSQHSPAKSIMLHLLSQDGQLWIQPEGYGEKCAEDGQGSPIGMEIWENRLRVVVFDDINSEEPKIIDLEKAKESNRDAG